MPGITLNTTFTGSGLPAASSLAAQIAAIASLKNWTQFDPDYVTLSGSKITGCACRAAKGATFAQATDAKRPSLVAAALGEYSAALFQGTDTVTDSVADSLAATGLTHTADTPFTIVAVVKPTNNTAADTLVSRFTSSSARVIVQVSAGSLYLTIGTAATINVAGVTIGAWNVIVAAWDGATMRLYLNGVEVSAAGTASTGSADWQIGGIGGVGSFDGLISDTMIFGADILAVPEQKALLLEYFANVYGL